MRQITHQTSGEFQRWERRHKTTWLRQELGSKAHLYPFPWSETPWGHLQFYISHSCQVGRTASSWVGRRMTVSMPCNPTDSNCKSLRKCQAFLQKAVQILRSTSWFLKIWDRTPPVLERIFSLSSLGIYQTRVPVSRRRLTYWWLRFSWWKRGKHP